MYYAKDGLKTVAEVEKITGLKRRQLYSYRGIVEPADTLKSSSYMLDNGKFCEGYKMYDDKGIMKLQQIAIFIKLGMKKSEIIEKMKEAGDNALSLLGEQEKLIKEKIKELNQSLAVIEQLKLMGMESPLTEVLAVDDLKKYGKRVLDVYSSEYKQQMVKIAETELDKHYEEIKELLISLAMLKEDEAETKQALGYAKKLCEIYKASAGLWGVCAIYGLVLGIQGNGQLKKSIVKELEISNIEQVGNIIDDCFWNLLLDTFDEVLEVTDKYESHFKKSNEADGIKINLLSKSAKAMANDVDTVLEKRLGVRNKDDYELLFEIIDNNKFYEETSFMDCLVQVMKHYYL